MVLFCTFSDQNAVKQNHLDQHPKIGKFNEFTFLIKKKKKLSYIHMLFKIFSLISRIRRNFRTMQI